MIWENEKFTAAAAVNEKKYFVKLTLIFSKIIAFTKFLSKLCEKSEFTVWKNEKFTVTEKKFRQINSIVTSLVKALFSRNFCQRYV